MTDPKEVKEVKPEIKPEVKVETPKEEAQKIEAPKEVKKDVFDDIFVTEDNTFDAVALFYKEGNNVIVESVDDNFSAEHPHNKTIMTFKYPSQGDITIINNHPLREKRANTENMDVREYHLLELARFLCLVRKWNMSKPLNNENIMSLNPKIVKAILNKIRDTIGTDGIF